MDSFKNYPTFTKIAKVEGRKPNLFEFYAETPPIFYKDTQKARAEVNENEFFRFNYAEPPPIFYKDSEFL